jgi:hypothetical protein
MSDARPDTCGTCRYLCQGQCRRRPPVAQVFEQRIVSLYPHMQGHDWCGEWAPTPTLPRTPQDQATARELQRAGHALHVCAETFMGKGEVGHALAAKQAKAASLRALAEASVVLGG